MWPIVSQVLARVLGDYSRSRGAAVVEIRGMDARELNDLGIGASEVDYVLRDGRQEAGSRLLPVHLS